MHRRTQIRITPLSQGKQVVSPETFTGWTLSGERKGGDHNHTGGWSDLLDGRRLPTNGFAWTQRRLRRPARIADSRPRSIKIRSFVEMDRS
jgi:hypothetical protein